MKKISIAISIIFIAISAFIFMTARTYPGGSNGAQGPGFFPMILSGIIVLLSVLLLINIRNEKDEPVNLFRKENLIVLLSLAVTLIYIVAINIVGFPISTVLYLFVLMAYFKAGWKVNICVSVLMTAILFIVFTKFLSVQLPQGVLF